MKLRLMSIIILIMIHFCIIYNIGFTQNESWRTNILAVGEQIGNAVYQAEITIGVEDSIEILESPPDPPEYTVSMKAWHSNWNGPYHTDIKVQGGENYIWIIGIDPHGNVPPPTSRCATLSWDTSSFCSGGQYILSEGYTPGGTIIVENMRIDTSAILCSTFVMYYLITFIPELGNQCEYIIGDANNSGSYNGLDITYGVAYLKGGPPPPYECECTLDNTWYVAGDVNSSCSYNGLDITYGVAYFKGGAAPMACSDCLPPGGTTITINERNTTLEIPENRSKKDKNSDSVRGTKKK